VLEARLRAPTTEQRHVFRARIVLLAADGRSTRSIAREVGTMPRTVSGWRARFAREGLAGLDDKVRPGPKPKYGQQTDRRILALLDQPPAESYARWTGPLIATALGDVHEQRVWPFLRAHKIDLSGRKSWCESHDPEFVAKAADVVGLYMAPPENAIVIIAHKKRRRRVEFLDFMNDIVAAHAAADTAIHVVLDNLNTHKPRRISVHGPIGRPRSFLPQAGKLRGDEARQRVGGPRLHGCALRPRGVPRHHQSEV